MLYIILFQMDQHLLLVIIMVMQKKRMSIHDCDDVPTEMNDENSRKNDTTYYCN
jgi:hypothetical protein